MRPIKLWIDSSWHAHVLLARTETQSGERSRTHAWPAFSDSAYSGTGDLALHRTSNGQQRAGREAAEQRCSSLRPAATNNIRPGQRIKIQVKKAKEDDAEGRAGGGRVSGSRHTMASRCCTRDLELAKTDDGGGDEEFSSEHRRPSPITAPNRQKASSPIDIPGKTKTGRATTGAIALALQAGFSKFNESLAGAGGSSLMIGSQVFVPPHVIVDRRAKRDTAMLMLVDVLRGG